ncbi:hypothetical protein C8J57DRAFT_1646529 [Mycena rebaudengoi]|nr:hypothetical protein C8J57DRAFT_1646529 [Mycena rebaudengoi]
MLGFQPTLSAASFQHSYGRVLRVPTLDPAVLEHVASLATLRSFQIGHTENENLSTGLLQPTGFCALTNLRFYAAPFQFIADLTHGLQLIWNWTFQADSNSMMPVWDLARGFPELRRLSLKTSTRVYCTISTKCSAIVTCDHKCSEFVGTCDRIFKCSFSKNCQNRLNSARIRLWDDNPADKLLKLDTTVGTLRDRSIGWILDAYHECNRKDLILKAFEMCAVGPFNSSHASLTSPAALAALRELPKTNPTLHMELTGMAAAPPEDENEDLLAEDEELIAYDDESDVPVEVLVKRVISRGIAALDGFVVMEDGDLAWNGVAEDAELDVVVVDLPLGRRQRQKKKLKLPGGDDMWEAY